MRVGMFHNLGPGGALRCFNEYAARLSERHTVRQFHLSGETRLRSVVRSLVAYRRMARVIDRCSLDVVFVHPCALFQAPPLLQFMETPTVYYMQEPLRMACERRAFLERKEQYRKRPIAGTSLEMLTRVLRSIDIVSAVAADRVVANSLYSVEAISRVYGIDALRCDLGVDTAVFFPETGCLRNRVVSVGALVPQKCHEFAIRIAAAVRQVDRPEVAVVWERGSEGERDRLVALSQDLGVELRLCRSVTDSVLRGLLSRSVATVCAARLEPFGLTSIESFACGTPVIAVEEAGYRDAVVHGVNGYFVERDPEAGADAFRELRRRPLPREVVRGTAERRWKWEYAIERIEEVFGEVVRDSADRL